MAHVFDVLDADEEVMLLSPVLGKWERRVRTIAVGVIEEELG